ncbi:MAG: manganese-dependent inorganic pyrophosphatase [Desulfovibrio desulfuricans]|jgi:manganese-dependent inorganic pyrophosphatase|uniref:manganese-dependent inorganic pyrophosphatase n=1 Tax=uncultured Desulfovibrio sp. TaxID=167968 RepID=UPI001B26F942|nr:manganese-dependent inorganic pyrophosphatase [uncultured Desulfovibrio sp.]MBE6442404.1 manganese-dependent inorganic pyrophosphatase [Desulfovibrio desulfuricans]MBO5490463.1 manganese-dependent inorganic pyrophosphatase [Desulfovibrio sp.]
MSALVIGHMNPDTDSITAAIACADLLKKLGKDVTPAAQGEPTPETKFVLDKFGLTAPQVVNDVAGKDIYMVDFSDLAQAPKGMDSACVKGIVDHHKLGDVTTSAPLDAWIWAVGCTGTVLKNMYDFYGVEIPKNIAGAMLCAILSDTVIFKSPTCTDADKKAVEALAKIAGVADVKALGMEMFKVKSAVDGASMHDLVFRDYKDFDMNGKKVGIGQLEVVDLSLLDKVKDGLQAEIAKVKSEGRHSVFLLLTDIMKEGSEMLIVSDDPSVVKKAFGVEPKGNSVWLDGVMSRKKQVVPNFEKAFK